MPRILQSFAAVFVVASLFISTASAQTQQRRPDFSGNWTLITGVSSDPLGGGGLITQDESTLTFRRAQPLSFDRDRSVTYRLDGVESRHTTLTIGGDVWSHASEARWVSNALLVTTKTSPGNTGFWEDILILWLDGAGDLNLMHVETTLDMQPVMSGTLAKYKKS